MNYSLQNHNSIILKTETEYIQISICDITHITCDDYIAIVHTINDEKYTIGKTIKELEKELSEFGFILANRSVIVNAKHIHKIIRGEKKKIVLNKIWEFDVSRQKWAVIKKQLDL